MTVDTPAWVRDAIFYQVFPDRFAASERVHKSGTLEPWDAPPTVHGFKGGDLRGVAERLGYLEDLGVTALYLNPVFASAANHRYHTYDYLTVDPLLGGDDALRELLDAAHDRGHAGRARWRVQPHRARVLAVPPHPRDRARPRRTAAGSGSTTRASTPAGRCSPTRRPARRRRPSATRRGGVCRPCRSSTPTTPRRASSCSASPSTGSASASMAGGSTCPRRSPTSRSGRSSARAAGPSTPTPTSSARSGTSRPSGSAATGSTR